MRKNYIQIINITKQSRFCFSNHLLFFRELKMDLKESLGLIKEFLSPIDNKALEQSRQSIQRPLSPILPFSHFLKHLHSFFFVNKRT